MCVFRLVPRFNIYSKLKQHHDRHHRPQITEANQPSENVGIVDDIRFDLDEEEATVIDPVLRTTFSSDVVNSLSVLDISEEMSKLFGSVKSTSYFGAELTQGPTCGAKHLVMKSQFGCISQLHQISSVDIDKQLLMAEFILSLKHQQRIVFAKAVEAIVSITENRLCNDTLNDNASNNNGGNRSCSFSLPTSSALIRSMFTEGKDALIPNLPRPSVTKVGRHSYMSLREIVAHHLAFASVAEATAWDDFTGGATEVLFSQRGRELFKMAQVVNNFAPTIPVYFTKWSDDFEPNSQAKQNRGSGWCFSVTFCLPAGCCRRSTYIVALGEKSWDHSNVEIKFLDELRALQGGNVKFYHAGFKGVVLCHVDIIAILKDQPERRKGVFVSMGNSRFTGRWGYSADLRGMYTKLPPCGSCKQKLRTGDATAMSTINLCDVCATFDYSRSALLCTDPPGDYPMDAVGRATLCNAGLSCYPQRLDFASMIAAVSVALLQMQNGIWSAAQSTAYLTIFGLNNELIRKVLRGNIDTVSTIIPCTWNEVSKFGHLVDVCMHLLGLGIAKTINKFLLRSWLVHRKLLSSFLRTSNKMLVSVKDLHLEWCKVLSSGSDQKLGGWVSENHFGWVRISRWLYKDVCNLTEDQPYVAPTVPVTRYTVKECKAWLTAHGKHFKSKDKVNVLRQLVVMAVADEIQPPTLIGPCGGPTYLVENVIKSLSATLSACMGPSECSESLPDAVDCYIKLFLSSVDDLEKCRPSSGIITTDPIWVSSYNYTSLLNLPDAMRMYGMPRFLWEGGPMGEGILRYIKPLINGLKHGWNTSCHTRFMTKMALQQVRGTFNQSFCNVGDDILAEDDVNLVEVIPELSDGGPRCSQYKLYDYFKYGNIESVNASFATNKPLSGIILKGDIVCIVTNGGCLIWQALLGPACVQRFGLWYHKVVLSDEPLGEAFRMKEVVTYCLLLPLFSAVSNAAADKSMYSVITKDWREMSAERCLEYCCGLCLVDLVGMCSPS